MFGSEKKEKGYIVGGQVLHIPIAEIQPNPDQTRQNFSYEKLLELSISIAENGLLQPITVSFRQGVPYLLAGERRLRAAKLAGLKTIPCISVDKEGVDRAVLTLAENLQREELNPFEEAEAISRLIETYGMKQEEVSYRLGYAQPTVANKLRLLKLSPDHRKKIVEAGLSERHARALLRLDEEVLREKLLNRIIRERLTVAGTERIAEAMYQGKRKKLPPPIVRDIRLFSNTIDRVLQGMLRAGIRAHSEKNETKEYIEYVVRIPKHPEKA